jgi:uncharacterized protein
VIRAVYDCNVIVSGIGWAGSARNCLKLVAERRVFPFVTEEILAEYEVSAQEILAEEVPGLDPRPKLKWIKSKFILIRPYSLGKPRSRDAKDDIYLACAIAASAPYLITYDRDLLVLEKPFGVQILRPPEFLRQIEF